MSREMAHTSTSVCGESGQSVRVCARRAAIPPCCEWLPSIICLPSPTSMLVCSRHRTPVDAHSLDAVSARAAACAAAFGSLSLILGAESVV